jgi:hypothetical protein
MALATHLGPWLLGTVKNSTNTSTTVSTAQIGTYRNTGSTVAVQTSPGGIAYTNTSATTLLTPGNTIQAVATTATSTTMTLVGTTAAAEGITSGLKVVGPGINGGTTVSSVSGSTITLSMASLTTVTAGAFLFFDPTAGYNNNPIVLPAGAFINNIYLDVLTAFNTTGTTTTTAAITVSLLNSTASYNLAALTATGSATTATLPVGRYMLGAVVGSSLVASNTTAIMLLSNVSGGQNTPTDQIVQATFSQSSTGTLTGATQGLATVSIEYSVRNVDGTYFPQTPNSSYLNVPY